MARKLSVVLGNSSPVALQQLLGFLLEPADPVLADIVPLLLGGFLIYLLLGQIGVHLAHHDTVVPSRPPGLT